MRLRSITILLLAFWALISTCHAGDLLLVDIGPGSSFFEKQLDLVCRFYGLEIEFVLLGEKQNKLQLKDTIERSTAQAIIITENALRHAAEREILPILRKLREKSVSLLIIGVTPKTNPRILDQWSGGAVQGCSNSAQIPPAGFCRVAKIRDVARELAGVEIPFCGKETFHLILDERKKPESIMEVLSTNEESLFPIFVKTSVKGNEVFFQAEMPVSDSDTESISEYVRSRFFEIVPLMMFVRYSLGEQCWHSAGDYANLTIDDPWLTEPYGHLSYGGLLKMMEKVNFHTTIAFIPWNFDRNRPEVVTLLRQHPDRFSISIHGNNHDHQEFYKYETKLGDAWSAKSLDLHEANIKQAIARMEKFKQLTKLSYDRIMVFPHGIAPAETLALLKKYNFLATVNTGNIPLGSREPKDPLYHFRGVTLEFENFPSLNRYSPKDRSQSDIAIDLFLDNPILLNGHHDFFKNGIEAFNKNAEVVNNIQPDIQWRSLGYIMQHLYLERLRDDGNYDIMTFSNNFILQNIHLHTVTFFVRKEESFSIPIKQVTLDGLPYPFNRSGSDLTLEVRIPAGESRHIVIKYTSDLDLTSIDVSKNDLRVKLLRALSDFRDLNLSKNLIGRGIVRFYYFTNIYKLGLKRLTLLLFILTVLLVPGALYFRRRFRKQ